jgi:hypothetical protein
MKYHFFNSLAPANEINFVENPISSQNWVSKIFFTRSTSANARILFYEYSVNLIIIASKKNFPKKGWGFYFSIFYLIIHTFEAFRTYLVRLNSCLLSLSAIQ